LTWLSCIRSLQDYLRERLTKGIEENIFETVSNVEICS
jgi:hypothetical protein